MEPHESCGAQALGRDRAGRWPACAVHHPGITATDDAGSIDEVIVSTLPTTISRWTVNRSPHVDKKSMEQFESRTHKRLIDILEPTAQTVDELKKLNLPSGVDITINV